MTIVFRRGFRGGRKRSMRPVIQSYKKVINHAEASFTSGFTNDRVALGVDSVAAGQSTATDTQVPTGSIIKYFEIQFACHNATEAPLFINCSVQYVLGGQTAIDPDAVGGNAQRNQVLHQDLFSVGANQNSTHKFKFRVPGKFQRLREGMAWQLTWSTNASVTRTVQMIYKFYR